MKILVVGASGLIGGALLREFQGDAKFHTTGTYLSLEQPSLVRLDITDEVNVARVLENERPDVILCPVANPNVELCETNPELTRRTNVFGSKLLIDHAAKLNSKLVFFSSEYIFDGINGPYSETDAPNPINEYGRQKLEVEKYMQEKLKDYLIIRTTVVYGWELHGKNFIVRLIDNCSKNIQTQVPIDQISSPTCAPNLSAVVRELVEKEKIGTYNVVGNTCMNRFEFAKLACKVFGLNESLIIPVKTNELQQKAKRPLKAGLTITKLQTEIKTKLLSPEEGLQRMRDERK